MIVFNDTYHWEGWGGKMRLGHGKCRLCIFDLRKADTSVVHLKPYLVVVTDVHDSPTSIRNYGGHIATGVVERFQIHPNRMVWVEYYPEQYYGPQKEKTIPERFDETEFHWMDKKAIQPRWKPLKEPLLGILKTLIRDHQVNLP